MRISIHILWIGMALSACKARPVPVERVDLDKAALEAYWKAQPRFTDLRIKANVQVDDGTRSMNASAKLLMRKDSVIWGSFGLFGLFEGFRVLITPDSFHMLDHLSHTYISEPTARLKELVGMNLDLADLQNVLLGKPAFAYSIYSLISTDSVLVIRATKDQVVNTLGINDQLQTYRSAFRSPIRTETGDFHYNEYKTFDGLNVPTHVRAEIKAQDKLSIIEMNYTDVDTTTITSFAFNIPSSYKRIQ